MLMRTKGIRQAEGESPYTVKTKGAIWWKEGDFTLLMLHLYKLGLEQRASSRLTVNFIFNLEAEPRSDYSLVESSSGQHEKGPRTEMIQGPPPSTCSYTVS